MLQQPDLARLRLRAQTFLGISYGEWQRCKNFYHHVRSCLQRHFSRWLYLKQNIQDSGQHSAVMLNLLCHGTFTESTYLLSTDYRSGLVLRVDTLKNMVDIGFMVQPWRGMYGVAGGSKGYLSRWINLTWYWGPKVFSLTRRKEWQIKQRNCTQDTLTLHRKDSQHLISFKLPTFCYISSPIFCFLITPIWMVFQDQL